MAVVTISRQYGSLGNEIATRVCELLDYRLFDKRLMAEVASDLDLDQDEIVDYSEDNYKLQSFVDRILNLTSPRIIAQVGTWQETESGSKTKTVTNLDEIQGINFVQKTIQSAYEQDNVVIVGRGGQAILYDRPDALHVRVIAPYDIRVQRLHNRDLIGLDEAKDAVDNHDRASEEYLKRFHGIDWADPLLYDLVINTGKLNVGTATQVIIGTIGHLRSPVKMD